MYFINIGMPSLMRLLLTRLIGEIYYTYIYSLLAPADLEAYPGHTLRTTQRAGVSAAAPGVFCSPARWACPLDIYIITYLHEDVKRF